MSTAKPAEVKQDAGLEGIVVHPAAAMFPLMEGDAFESFVADIQEHGLRLPVVFREGVLLDGRNRLRACIRLGIKPKHVDWNGGGSPTAYIVSANLMRRDLTPSQKAMIAADLEPEFEKEAKQRQRTGKSADGAAGGRGKKKPPGKNATGFSEHRARDEAAAAVKVSPRYVAAAKMVKVKSPALAEEVRAGKMTLQKALRKVKPDPNEIAKKDPVVRWMGIVDRTSAAVISLLDDSGGVKAFLKQWSGADRTAFAASLSRLIASLRLIEKELE